MSNETSPHRSGQGGQSGGDPWAAFGYLVAGVGVYGFLGWGLGSWLGASYLTPLGIVLGAAFGLYLVFHRYAAVPAPPHTATDHTTSSSDTDDAGTTGANDR